MTLIPIGVLVLLSASAFAQAPNNSSPPTVQRLCGKLEQTKDVPVKGEPNNLATKEQDARHAAVSLYSADANGQCCELATAVTTTMTNHWGNFHLKSKHLPEGIYWLQVEWNGRKYRMLVHYAPKRYPDQLCSETEWEINDAGDFRKVEFITVD